MQVRFWTTSRLILPRVMFWMKISKVLLRGYCGSNIVDTTSGGLFLSPLSPFSPPPLSLPLPPSLPPLSLFPSPFPSPSLPSPSLPSPSLFTSGLSHFPELTAELERAIGEVKYGDYIMAGADVSTCGCGTFTMSLSPIHCIRVLSRGGFVEGKNERERETSEQTG